MSQAIPVSAFRDNYIWLLPVSGKQGSGRESSRVAIVDPGDARPVITALQRLQLEPVAILITHHHHDHTGGVHELTGRYPVPVYGPEHSNIAGIDHPLREGDRISIDDHLKLQVIEVPGHTLDHIAYYGDGMLLCGDTLFTGGCGRLFEGSAEQMYRSLQKISALPGETQVFCAHEYTLLNLEFAKQVEPDNKVLAARLAEARRLRAMDRPTVPSLLDDEIRTNPFLRCREPDVIRAAERHCGEALADEHEVFSVIRGWKDRF